MPRVGVVLAAGSGSRLGYLGGLLPKTMVPVRGRPLLYYALQTLSQMGATDARVALRSDAGLVADYLRTLRPSSLGLRSLRPVWLKHPTRSPVETLAKALPSASEGTVAVVLGDDLTQAHGLGSWMARFERSGACVGQGYVVEPDRAAIQRTCELVVGGAGRLLAIREKPRSPRGRLRGCGLYLFQGEALPPLLAIARAAGSRGSLSDVVGAGLRCGRGLALRIDGRNINVNTVGDVMRAWSLVPRDRGAPL